MAELLFNRYQLETTLAQSADAQTYRAYDPENQCSVVVKRLQLGRLNAWKRLELFEREARVLATLNHPQIPRLLDFFREETPEGLNAWLVSTWIEGESLATRIEKHWLPDETTALRLAEQLLWILEYLHAFQPPVVHRDIKPSNLILNEAGQLYLIDFGGAQQLLQPTGGGGSTVIGTFGYMAPEQFAGRATPASDLYGLGTCLIHLLSGTAPVQIPQRNLQLMFQGLIQGSGGMLRWLTQMVRPGQEDRFRSAAQARQQLYAMTGLTPAEAPISAAAPPLSASLRQLLSRAAGQVAETRAPSHLLAVGEQLQGYTITRQLAHGSHTASYFATAPDGREVFLKALHFQSLEGWKGLTLFEREIAALQRLEHPGVPRFLETFKHQDQDLYLVTERIDGQNLDEKQRTGWRPLEAEVIALALQALEILEHLHQQKPPIVHRDLKPSNFLLDDSGKLYLIDFGGIQSHFQHQGTGGSTVIGTYGYIAPEEFLKKAVPATDLYSLGVTLVRLLTGYEPTALPQQDLRLNFRKLLNCSEPLKNWLETMTEPDLQQRFRSASQARAVLSDHLAQFQAHPNASTKTSTAAELRGSAAVGASTALEHSRMFPVTAPGSEVPLQLTINTMPPFEELQKNLPAHWKLKGSALSFRLKLRPPDLEKADKQALNAQLSKLREHLLDNYDKTWLENLFSVGAPFYVVMLIFCFASSVPWLLLFLTGLGRGPLQSIAFIFELSPILGSLPFFFATAAFVFTPKRVDSFRVAGLGQTTQLRFSAQSQYPIEVISQNQRLRIDRETACLFVCRQIQLTHQSIYVLVVKYWQMQSPGYLLLPLSSKAEAQQVAQLIKSAQHTT